MLDVKCHQEGASHKEDLVFSLAEVAALAPTYPPSPSCAPPTLPTRPNCNDQSGEHISVQNFLFSARISIHCWVCSGLTGEVLSSPRKLVLLLLFSFEADTLEVKTRIGKWVQLSWISKYNLCDISNHMIPQLFEGGPEGAAWYGGQDFPCGGYNNAQSSESFSLQSLPH